MAPHMPTMNTTRHCLRLLLLLVTLLAIITTPVLAKHEGWQHTGSLFILTTPEGADLPASAMVEGFPVLVRLRKDSFDFTKAQAHGEDVRFATSDGVARAI